MLEEFASTFSRLHEILTQPLGAILLINVLALTAYKVGISAAHIAHDPRRVGVTIQLPQVKTGNIPITFRGFVLGSVVLMAPFFAVFYAAREMYGLRDSATATAFILAVLLAIITASVHRSTCETMNLGRVGGRSISIIGGKTTVYEENTSALPLIFGATSYFAALGVTAYAVF